MIARDLIEELINVSKPSLISPSLQSIIRTLSAVTKTLEEVNSTDMVTIHTLKIIAPTYVRVSAFVENH